MEEKSPENNILAKGNYSCKYPCKLIEKLYSKLPIEKTNLSFMKWILGVHRKTSNFAVLGDLVRHPFLVDVILNTFKFQIVFTYNCRLCCVIENAEI